MTEPEEIFADLDAIKDSGSPPSEQPDPATTKELKQASKRAAKLTPTELHDAACKYHIADLKEDSARLRQAILDQKSEMERQISELRIELDVLRPAHATLQERYSGVLATNVFSTIMAGLGGLLISGAGFIRGDVWKIGRSVQWHRDFQLGISASNHIDLEE